MVENKLTVLTELCNVIYLHSVLKPGIVHCFGMALMLEVLFRIFVASCCFEWPCLSRVESLVGLQCLFLEFVVVVHYENFSFFPGLLADFHAGIEFASSVLKGSIDWSKIAVINLFSYPRSHFYAFGIPSLFCKLSAGLYLFTLYFRVV